MSSGLVTRCWSSTEGKLVEVKRHNKTDVKETPKDRVKDK